MRRKGESDPQRPPHHEFEWPVGADTQDASSLVLVAGLRCKNCHRLLTEIQKYLIRECYVVQ